MANSNRNKKIKTTQIVSKGKKQEVPNKGLFIKLEQHLNKRKSIYLLLCLLTSSILSLLMFNVRITEGFDDALYIEAGYRYATGFFKYYYTATAPLYCMFLALPIALFGVNLVVLKLFSVLFFVLGLYFLYRAFRGRVSYAILFPALLLTAVNSSFLYYASQTYTETFTLMIAGLFFMAWFNLDDATQAGADVKSNWGKYLWLGFVVFLYYIARNVAVVGIVVLIAYFLFYKKYLVALYSTLSFGFFTLLYQKVIMPICWGHLHLGNQFAGQSKAMFQKDVYNAGLGQEDFSGLVIRFFENAKIYSSQLFDLLYLKSEATPRSYLFFVLLLLLAGIGISLAIAKKQKYVIGASLYVAMFLGATFISLHTFWGQSRLIMVYIPFIAIVVFYGITELLKKRQIKWFQWIYLAGIVIVLLLSFSKTIDAAKKNFPTLKKNLAGNKYYGYTLDWVNYFKMSEWAAQNIEAGKGIICRKAPMSFVYTGREFAGLVGVPTVVMDSALHTSSYQHKFIGVVPSTMTVQAYHALLPYMRALLLGDNSMYYTYDVPQQFYDICIEGMNSNKTTFYVKPEEMSIAVKKDHKDCYGVYPDVLLEQLKNGNVGYVIDASLRANSAQKTDNVISTVRRYMYFVEQKYAGTFQKIHQIGGDDEEPAMIYEVHYPDNYRAE